MTRTVSLGVLADRFGMAGVGALLLLLAIPAFLFGPLPTGIPVAAAAALIGMQLLLGLRRPRLPGWARRFELRREQVAGSLARRFGLLRRLGLRLRRRWPSWVGRDGAPRPLSGMVLVACGVVLVLPLPFGNQLPSLAIAASGLGLLRRDGAFVLAGYLLALATLAWTAFLVLAGAEMLARLGNPLAAW